MNKIKGFNNFKCYFLFLLACVERWTLKESTRGKNIGLILKWIKTSKVYSMVEENK
jgi:hypothetical protein